MLMENKLRSDIISIWTSGMEACQPGALIDRKLLMRLRSSRGSQSGSVYLVGCGKAAYSMASALLTASMSNPDVLDPELISGVVAVPHGYTATLPKHYAHCGEQVQVLEAGHPIPDVASIRAVQTTIDFLQSANLSSEDCVIALVSGGGSATWGAPIDGLSLADLSDFVEKGIKADVDIVQLNAIRRLLTRFGSGGLLKYTGDAHVVSLVVSDVPTDDISVVASGPTHSLRLGDGFAASHHLINNASSIIDLARREYNRRRQEESVSTVEHLLLADNRLAVSAAQKRALELGYRTPSVLQLTGPARESGHYIARMTPSDVAPEGIAVIAGGETTVDVKGTGTGGRNQECALGVAELLDRQPGNGETLFLCAGTDGVDGPTNAAGAIVSAKTVHALTELGENIADIFSNNDSFRALGKVDSLFVTGPTHTNVMDLGVLLRK